MIISGIYKIINKVDGKYYVGSSRDILEFRWPKHKRQLINNNHPNDYLQNSWNKYGIENFEFTIIEKIPKEKLIEVEQKYLDVATTEQDKCYNLNFESNGGELSEYSKKKISIKSKIRFSNKENHPMFGKNHTEEVKKRIGNFSRCRFHSDESKQKIANSKSQKILWKFINSEGKVVDFKNLSEFCRKNMLGKSHMSKVFRGKEYSHKGWKSVVESK